MKKRFGSVRLSTLINISVALVFIVAAALTIAVVNQKMRQQALVEAEAKMRLMLDHNMAVHAYFTQRLKPSLFAWTEPFRDEDYFDPTWMSSTYAVREMEAYFTTFNPEDYYYKDAAVNARSPENEADADERAFLGDLRANPDLGEWSAVRTIDGKPYLVVLRPGEVLEASCLRCHSDPAAAPRGLVDWFGAERSFHREPELGQVISAVSVRVPLSVAYEQADRLSVQLSLLLLVLLGTVFAVQYWLSRRWVFQPLERIRGLALQISGDSAHLGEQIAVPFGRELHEVTTAFNTMSVELSEAQEQLLRQERLAVLGQLTGGIGHELRTPLGNIGNATYLLGMLLDETTDPAVREALDLINQGVADADGVVGSLLSFARTRAPARQTIDILTNLEQTVARLAVPDGITVQIATAEDTALPQLRADPDQLGKVFGNLIANAIQAMPDGGIVTVRMQQVARGARDGIQVAVADTGTGIAPEAMPRLFEPLFTTKHGGIGLGLALAKILVEAHGGTIAATSEPGAGATFTVWLPLGPRPAACGDEP